MFERKIGDFDDQSEQALVTVKADAVAGSQLGVNGRRIPGAGVPPAYFAELIELELKRAK